MDNYDKNICFIGAGYVGGPTASVIAKHCPGYCVHVVDINQQKIDAWNSSTMPIYEPNLSTMVLRSRGKNLFFSSNVSEGIARSKIIFIAVHTPTKDHGLGKDLSYDLSAWEAVARQIAKSSPPGCHKIIVEKSTVPVKTGEKVRLILDLNKKSPETHFDVVSNPEFLAEGSAISNLENPDRVLIGGVDNEEGRSAVDEVARVFQHWVPENQIIRTNLWSSELAKLACNAFLSQRISSINALSAVCEATGAQIDQIERVLGTDKRLGPHFLKCSVGFGGSCFKKDVLGLVYLCECYKLTEVAEYWRQIITINEYQKERFAQKILSTMFGTVKSKRICILGFAFKKNTGDIRESAAISVSKFLLEENAEIVVYDPQVKEEDIHALGSPWNRIKCVSSAEEGGEGAHALVFLTEWDEFLTLDFEDLRDRMQKPQFIFDGRNILPHSYLSQLGFFVHAVGKQSDALDTSAR